MEFGSLGWQFGEAICVGGAEAQGLGILSWEVRVKGLG